MRWIVFLALLAVALCQLPEDDEVTANIPGYHFYPIYSGNSSILTQDILKSVPMKTIRFITSISPPRRISQKIHSSSGSMVAPVAQDSMQHFFKMVHSPSNHSNTPSPSMSMHGTKELT